jgi:hypothetical protein
MYRAIQFQEKTKKNIGTIQASMFTGWRDGDKQIILYQNNQP